MNDNQCDGCRAGKPLINGIYHRMGLLGSPSPYSDLIICTKDRYTSPKPAPAPWTQTTLDGIIYISDAKGWDICEIHPSDPEDERQATANLIVTAPRLLARTEAAEAERDALRARVAALEEVLGFKGGL